MLTYKQKHCILLIEKYTNHQYNGMCWEEAVDFIDRYMNEMVDSASKPTKKQVECAEKICKNKKIKHNCRTKRDYIEFIGRHIGHYIK